jgi:starvation-inducible DNA-binding protein
MSTQNADDQHVYRSSGGGTAPLYVTKNTLPEAIRRRSVDLLGQSLATAIDMQRQAKQAHWNVKGPHFFSLHQLFDEVHTAAIEWADLCAERLVALGGTADGRVENVAAQTWLEAYPLTVPQSQQHVRQLSTALAVFGEQVHQSIIETGDLFDPTSSDLFTQISRGVDEYLWKVEAHEDGS